MDYAAIQNRERQLLKHARRKAKKAKLKAERKEKLQLKKPKKAKRSKAGGVSFYKTMEWKRTRYEVLLEADGRCVLCGGDARDGRVLNVDHIKPLAKYPHLALDKNNLQVLCCTCNAGKGGWDETDWRD